MGHIHNGPILNSAIGAEDIILDSRLRDDALMSIGRRHLYSPHLHQNENLQVRLQNQDGISQKPYVHHQIEPILNIINFNEKSSHTDSIQLNSENKTGFCENRVSAEALITDLDLKSDHNIVNQNQNQDYCSKNNADTIQDTHRPEIQEFTQLNTKCEILELSSLTRQSVKTDAQSSSSNTISEDSNKFLVSQTNVISTSNHLLCDFNQTNDILDHNNDPLIGQASSQEFSYIQNESPLIELKTSTTNANNILSASIDSDFEREFHELTSEQSSNDQQSNDETILNSHHPSVNDSIASASDNDFNASNTSSNQIKQDPSLDEKLASVVTVNEHNHDNKLNGSFNLHDSGIKLDSLNTCYDDEIDCSKSHDMIDSIINYDQFNQENFPIETVNSCAEVSEADISDNEDEEIEDDEFSSENEECDDETTPTSASIDDGDEEDAGDDDVEFENNDPREVNVYRTTKNEMLSGERMLEVTKMLVRSTERDPDRDLRKQVLLKTAIKKLPQYIECSQRYTENLDGSFQNLTQQSYYLHHESISTQPKFYQSVQPNAIQVSTTGLRMLDLNDSIESEYMNNDMQNFNVHAQQLSINGGLTNHASNPNQFVYSTCEDVAARDCLNNLSQHDQNYNRFEQSRNPDHLIYHNGESVSRRQSFNNLFPQTGTDIVGVQGHNGSQFDWEFAANRSLSCCPSDVLSESKIDMSKQNYSNIGNADDDDDDEDENVDDDDDDEEEEEEDEDEDDEEEYVDDEEEEEEEEENDNTQDDEDEYYEDEEDDQNDSIEGSVHENVANDSSPDRSSDSESENVATSTNINPEGSVFVELQPSKEPVLKELHRIALLESNTDDSIRCKYDNSINCTRSNKRSSSSLGIDDGMEIDDIIELSTKSPINVTNSQFKKLRKRELE